MIATRRCYRTRHAPLRTAGASYPHSPLRAHSYIASESADCRPLVAMFWPRLSGLLAVVAVASAAQHSFTVQQGVNFAADQYDAGLFTPLGDLSALSTDVYTALSHPLFPNYNVRIKKSDFCDGTVGCVVTSLRSGPWFTDVDLCIGHTLATSTSRLDISSSTSSRAGTTPQRTTLSSGPTEVRDVPHLSVSSWSLVSVGIVNWLYHE